MRQRKKEEEKRGTEREIAKPANIAEQTAMRLLVLSWLTAADILLAHSSTSFIYIRISGLIPDIWFYPKYVQTIFIASIYYTAATTKPRTVVSVLP